jgi:hypothetical protein
VVQTKGIAAAKGKISLSGLTITPYPDKQFGKKYCFGVKAANTERTYVLVAGSSSPLPTPPGLFHLAIDSLSLDILTCILIA